MTCVCVYTLLSGGSRDFQMWGGAQLIINIKHLKKIEFII